MFAEELVCRSRVCVGPTGAEATRPTHDSISAGAAGHCRQQGLLDPMCR